MMVLSSLRFLGPAEVVTWGLLGYVWSFFTNFSDGFADAAELRCTHHLDMNNPEMARMTAYKALYLGFSVGMFCASLIFLVGEDLVGWITPDTTLQSLAAALLPLIGIGQAVSATSIVAWSLVKAQGRSTQASAMHILGNWCIATSVGGLLVLWLRVNLQGLLAALVLGSTISAFGNLYIINRSQWDRLAKISAISYQEDAPSAY